MTPQEEFRAALEQFEKTVTQLGLVAQTFRRLERELWGGGPATPRADVKSSDSIKEGEDFLEILEEHGLGIHERNILYNLSQSKDYILNMQRAELLSCRGCGIISVAKIRAVLEIAGYAHRLAEGWDTRSRLAKAYEEWLPRLREESRRRQEFYRERGWLHRESFEKLQDAVRN